MIDISGRGWIYRVMGIDNGSNTVGVAIEDYDLRTGVGTVVHAQTLTADKTAYELFAGLVEHHGKLAARKIIIKRFIQEILEEFEPDIVGCESPFAHLHVHSFATLLECMLAVEDAVYEYCETLVFAKIPPGKAKKAVCPKGQYSNKKESIRHFILINPDIVEGEGVSLNRLDEHSIDGIAVAHCLAQEAQRAFT